MHIEEEGAMDDERLEQVLAFFKALADANRLRIVGLLAERERSVEELAALLALKPPAVSHHLSKLKEQALVRMRAEGTTHVYALDTERLHALNRAVLQQDQVAALADSVEGTTWERKVLRDFFDGERLKSIPASQNKRLVVLRWLAEQFPLDLRLSERDVNERLQRHHPDFATLRRLLVDQRLLARTPEGVYWRPAAPVAAG